MNAFIFYFIILQAVLLIPSFFFYRRITRKLTTNYIQLKSIIATIFLPVVYTLAFSFICFEFIDPIWRNKGFDSKDWIENSSGRYRMVNNLIESELLIGKTKNEVVEILGGEFRADCLLGKEYCYIAHDPDEIVFLDEYTLIVHFDENNRVKAVSYQLN